MKNNSNRPPDQGPYTTFENISKKFRQPRLQKWREFLESLPEADDPLAQMVRLIERDLLEYSAQVLPIDGRDIMDSLRLDPGPDVGKALQRAQELFRSGVRGREDLLSKLRDWRERIS